MQDSSLKLLKATTVKNKYGIDEKTFQETQIFCRVSSVSGAEFNAAQQNGIRPQYKFIIRSREYSGEKIVEYEGQRYAIYRTYQSGMDDIELYVEEREGI